MAEPAYETLDLPEHEQDLQKQIVAITGGKHLTLAELTDSLKRNGADPALLDAATQLPEEHLAIFRERFNAERRARVWPPPRIHRRSR